MRPNLTSEALREIRAADQRQQLSVMAYLDSFDGGGRGDESLGAAAAEATFEMARVLHRHGLSEFSEAYRTVHDLAAPF